ncbi:Valine--tRNA ligase, mitochondrial [Collichthys lucidus]|uniref:Valine--tRNA ligase, mitochondrial n=1 Tax=Collichthys lucidus TaxID=240159 RepID=A0A4U5VLF2_COLLU|nr:Valine--tRNA ligase, mitochondrial [Collichthys lucidus]
MWRAGQLLRLTCRGGRLCSASSSSSSSSFSSFSSQSNSSLRPQKEKQRRRRERDEAILSNQPSAAEDEAVTWSEKQKIVYTAQTPAGTKKDTSLPFPSEYSPDYVEASWYQWWEKEGFFRPERHETLPHSVDRTFSLCIPPPNVTGTLHIGHALTVACGRRSGSMSGEGCKATECCGSLDVTMQTVVERKLLREHGKRRHDFTRQEFLQQVWKWKNEKGDKIYPPAEEARGVSGLEQGVFHNGSSKTLALNPPHRAVTEAFVRLCDSGLIYRSEGLVNWSCALESAISDIEVDSKELSGQTALSVPGYENKVEFGTMLTFAYPIDGQGEAVHGKHCRHPFTHRLLPIITDSLVDMELGTGAVKVTPAHDHTDFLLSQRHSLPRLTVIGGDGTMTRPCGRWLEVHGHHCHDLQHYQC